MQITDHLYAMRPMKEPATAAWGLRISDTDAEKLKAGCNGRNWRTLNAKILGRAVAYLSIVGQKKLSSINLILD